MVKGIQSTILLLICAVVLQYTRADAPAAGDSPFSDPCKNCAVNGLKCLTCGDGRHACITKEQADEHPVCCGCAGTGPGSICTLCLPNDPCIKSSWGAKPNYYCYNPSYLEVLNATINQTQYPINYLDSIPTAGEKAGWIILGAVVGLILMPSAVTVFVIVLGCRDSSFVGFCSGCGGGGGDGSSGGGSNYGSSWSNDNSSSSWSNDTSTSSSWSSGPSYAASAD
eukprot:TRINITY_DN11874_c0_g1_i2.p1 TRINITY_DN11874_c0_g1~~TRINITY_DN11874_c0_g1_i2.p1  ORF type:complete len:225 (-),score=10.70 TRINITY_DN11874_c0_g1_i2:245-919(-)